MKFAFLIMGKFNSETDKAAIHNGVSQLIGVADIEDARLTARNLYEMELTVLSCAEPLAQREPEKIIEATENKIPVGYVTHLPEQEEVYQAAFLQIKLMYWEQRAGRSVVNRQQH